MKTKKNYVGYFLPFLLVLISLLSCNPKEKAATENESTSDLKNKLEWFHEAKFGLFIHWGLYAIPAGEWGKGKGHAEWIRHTAQIPIDEYDKFVDQFNALRFTP